MRSRKKNISILALITFFISPILSLPFIFFSIYCKEKLGLFVLSLFCGVLSYAILPSWDHDLSRYYLLYEEIKVGGFSSFLTVVKDSNDYVFFFVYYLFSLLGFHFQFLLFTLSTLCFYTSLIVFDNLIKKYNPSRGIYFLFITSFILSLPVLSLLSVTRFSLGYTFFLLFVYSKLNSKERLSYFYLLLACLTHFSYLVYLPFILVFSFFKDRIKINIVLMFIIAIVFGLNVLGGLLNYAQYIPFISDKIVTYATIYEDTTLPVLSYSLLLAVVIAIMYYFLYSKFLASTTLQMFLVVLLVVLMTIPFNLIIYDRFIQVFKPILVITIMYTMYRVYMIKHRRLILKFIIFFLYIPFSLYYLYTFYVVYKDSLSGFLSLGNLLLLSIFSSNYTHLDFLK